jgi:hypothetical protein
MAFRITRSRSADRAVDQRAYHLIAIEAVSLGELIKELHLFNA